MKQDSEKNSAQPVWQYVRAMIASAWQLLSGEEARRYIRAAQAKISAAENAVRRWLAERALELDLPAAEIIDRADAPPEQPRKKTSKPAPRGFSVLPPALRSASLSLPSTPVMDIASTWLEDQTASLRARAERLPEVRENPERFVRRLARMLRKRDAISIALRFYSAGHALPKEGIRKFLSTEALPVPINDSS